ncbi:MAG: DegT/DnrJ/EryC1/StrS family aminotransferase [Anaerolineae bacterium]|nr:DegT/DnrJ/EryC1/StrS family aminotransferase [Anaerolineae bacterium]
MRLSFLPFALPDTDEAEINEIVEALQSGWVTTGPKTKKFESQFALAVGAKHAIAVNSCTAAMHLALEAIGLKQGDEIITTPYTFAATAEVIQYFGAKPVFVDVSPIDLNINPELIEAAITKRTKAIIPVHIAGLPVELNAIYDIAARYNLAVIEDAAHALPAKYQDCFIGQDLNTDTSSIKHQVLRFTCFSFYATKTITTGEGGMICTDNELLAERCRMMSLHGISKDAWKRYTAEGSWYYEIVAPGYKYNMTDISAAMGLAQLRKIDQMWLRRQEIAAQYNQTFCNLPGLQIPADRNDCQHAWHLYILRLNLDKLNISRSQFIEALKVRNIGTSVHFIPLHLHPYYRNTYAYNPLDFPVAYKEFQRVVSLPIYSKMSDKDVNDVISSVQEVVSHGKRN